MEIIIGCIYILHQTIAANLDLFYFLSLSLLATDIIQRKKLTLKAVGYIYLIVLYALLQIVMNDQIDIQRLVINVAKIYLNVFLFLQVRDMNLSRFSMKKMINVASLFNVMLLIIGLIFKTDMLWRLDDAVNKHQTTRFSLLYYEPSEASFHVTLLIVLLFYYALREKEYKKNMINIFFISTNAIVVALSAGMGGMLSLALAIMTMYIYYLREKISVGKVLMFIVLTVIGVFSSIFFMTSNNSYYLRITDIMSGNDGSVVYRINVSFRVMQQMLLDTHYLGIGFGNLNTDSMRNSYSNFGLVDVISNSFMYVIAEGGIMMMLLLLVFLFSILLPIRPEDKLLKYALFIFIISYQIAGGYFTNPINWIIYGLIANKVFMSRDFKHRNSDSMNSSKLIENRSELELDL